MDNLYLLKTTGLGYFHVIANDPTEAQNSLEEILAAQDYGFVRERRVIQIELLTSGLRPSLMDKSKPFLSDKERRLLIVEKWRTGQEIPEK